MSTEYSQTTLARILNQFNDDHVAAMRYCVGIALRFQQFAEEYNGYAQILKQS